MPYGVDKGVQGERGAQVNGCSKICVKNTTPRHKCFRVVKLACSELNLLYSCYYIILHNLSILFCDKVSSRYFNDMSNANNMI